MKRLEVAHVVLGLGAVSSFDVLDFFPSAQRGDLVVTPQLAVHGLVDDVGFEGANNTALPLPLH
jgi:hypothetical protein